MQNRLLRLAAFQNPEFYKAQAMRLSTFDKPRVIACGEDLANHIALPRGCFSDLLALLEAHRITPLIQDERFAGTPINVDFHGQLRPLQEEAVANISVHDEGILCAPTAFGKTAVAAWLIAARKVNSLILVHRQQLMDQWRERLAMFLQLSAKSIGEIGGGKTNRTGCVDVAVIQSLNRKETVKDFVAEYGVVKNLFVLKGGMSKKQRQSTANALAAVPLGDQRVILATGSYIGEGFDDARLDTLFLAMPISWKGTLQQYVGRLHRLHDNKQVVQVYDYVDSYVPMLARMYERRLKGYAAIGYTVQPREDAF